MTDTTAGDLTVDLAANGLLPPLPTAFLAGEDRDLLSPISLVEPSPVVGGASVPELPPPPGGDTGGDDFGRRRASLARALGVANRSYGHPKADELAERLADPQVRVVVGGQQPGFLGGPLYTLSKAVAISRWADALTAAGQPAVGVFWVATEDHDWHEVARATVLTHKGPLEVALGEEDPEPLVPVGMRTLGPGADDALATLREAMPGDRYEAWLDQLAQWYRPDARFGEAFCRLLPALLGEHTPLLMDSMLSEVKAQSRPHLSRLVERRQEVEAAYAEADRRIEERGHPLQVHPQRGVSPLFLYQGGQRRRVGWVGDGGDVGDRYELRGADGEARPVADLLETIADNPSAVSPGVLARPVIQDALLGTSLMVLGPGELSYMPQVAPLYEVLGVAAPHVTLRPQALVLESHQIDKLEETGLTLAQLLAPEEELERLLAADRGGFVAGPRERALAALDALEGPALELDASLEGPLGKTRKQVERALEAFAGKVQAAAARRDEVRANRVRKLRATVLPGGKLQERVVCSAHYRGKYVERFDEAYWQQMDLDGSRLQVVTP